MDLEEIIRKILIRVPEARDDDILLIIYVHTYQACGDCKKESIDSFLYSTPLEMLRDMQRKKTLSKESEIERKRRKVQEKYPVTRGFLWEERHEASKIRALEEAKNR